VRRTIDNARLTAMVEHPNLVRIFHVGEESGWSFVEMEFVDGLDLARVLHTR
jgi:serine/threonine protein kinase